MEKTDKFKLSSVLGAFAIFTVIGVAETGLALLISNRYDLMGWTNAVTFATALHFALLIIFFVSGQGAFDMLVYGLKSFWGGFKRDYDKNDYFEYVNSKEKTSKNVYLGLFLSFLLYLIATIVLFILVKQ